MKKILVSVTILAASSLFFACEDDVVPVPLPPPPLPVTETQETPAAEPADSSVVSDSATASAEASPATANETADTATKAAAAPEPKTEAPAIEQKTETPSSDIGQLNAGKYTIQVGIYPTEQAAKELIKKLAENKISAYSVRVNNPAQLLGSYYRVRVGYFNGKSIAEKFAEERLKPLGFAWWVDDIKNDSKGNTAADAPKSAAQTQTPAEASARKKWENEPKAETPPPAQTAQPAPAAKTTTPAAVPAPQQTAAPKTATPAPAPQTAAPAAPKATAPTPAPAAQPAPVPQNTANTAASKEVKVNTDGKIIIK